MIETGNSLDPEVSIFYTCCQKPGPGADLVATHMAAALEVRHVPVSCS